VELDSAQSYSLLAGTGVVNTGTTTLSGDPGVSPALRSPEPRRWPVRPSVNDAQAIAAREDLITAYNEVNARTPHAAVVGNLGGNTFRARHLPPPPAALALTGTLTLDAQGNPNAIFIFQSDAAIDTAAASNVVLINGASACLTSTGRRRWGRHRGELHLPGHDHHGRSRSRWATDRADRARLVHRQVTLAPTPSGSPSEPNLRRRLITPRLPPASL
jgi:hypothetical protein